MNYTPVLKKNRFLKGANDFEGRPQLLGLFNNSKEFQKGKSDKGLGTRHHFTFALEKENFESGKTRLEKVGIAFKSETYEVFCWHSTHFYDPDGHSVAFVCYNSDRVNIEKNTLVR